MAERMEKRRGDRGLTGLLTAIIILLLGTGARVAAGEEKMVKEGGAVTLVPTYKPTPKEFTWKLGGNKVGEMELNPLSTVIYKAFEGRAEINASNGILTIRNLTVSDSGVYKAEVVKTDNTIDETEITLTVLPCPPKPMIYNQSTSERIILFCNSSTKDVTYEWQNKPDRISGQTYNVSRPKKVVTLTCVVQNAVCSNNASITFPYIAGSDPGAGIAVGVCIALLVAAIVGSVVLYKKNPTVKSFVDSKLSCKGNQVDENQPLIVRDGGGCSVTLILSSKIPVVGYKFQKDEMPSIEAVLTQLQKSIEKLLVTVEKVNPAEYDAYNVEVNGKTTIPELEGGKIVFTVLNKTKAEEVTTITLKKGDDILCQWQLEGLKLQTKNITLEPGFVTIQGLEEKDSGSYKVDMCSDKGNVIQNQFKLKVTKQVGNIQKMEMHQRAAARERVTEQAEDSQDIQKMELKIEKVVTRENGLAEDQIIGNVTFHLNSATNPATETPFTWMRDGRQLGKGGKIEVNRNGDLTINQVTPDDQGTYTVRSGDQILKYQFILL